MHYLYCIVGEDKLPYGVAVALLYTLEPAPITMYFLDERERLLRTIELSVSAKCVCVVLRVAHVDEKRVDILVPSMTVVPIFACKAHGIVYITESCII